MKRRIATIFFCILCCLSAMQAQTSEGKQKKERTIALWGHVKDHLTKVGIVGSKVTLMRPDSTVVDSMEAWDMGKYQATKVDVGYRFTVPAREAKYIIRAEHPDYETCYVNYEIKHVARNTFFDAPWHLMKRKPKQQLAGEHELGEVVVKATRVKMVYKGDTIVYNADAFNLPEGSMLDALIRQMDGVELKDDGRIIVNGEQIEELTLNGKDFFKGNNRVMLDNLPHYVVQNVQVYHKRTEKSEYLGRDVEKRKYVMDVVLKREYAEGFIANAEVAGGTHDRYLARLFGMRYTDNSRLTLFGNTNNVNESRKPGSNGEWQPSNQPTGRRTQRMAGADLFIDEADKRWRDNASLTASWTKHNNWNETESENFLANSASTFGRSASDNRTHHLDLHASNNFVLQKPFHLQWFAEMRYNKGDGDLLNRSAQLSAVDWLDALDLPSISAELDTLLSASLSVDRQRWLVNRNRQQSQSRSHRIYGGQYVDLTRKLASGDEVGMKVNMNFHNQRQRTASTQRVDYPANSEAIATAIDRKSRTPDREYSFYAAPSYTVRWLNGFAVKAIYTYSQQQNSDSNDAYLLDSIGYGIDLGNSFHRTLMKRGNELKLQPGYYRQKESGYVRLSVDLPLQHTDEELHYTQPSQLDGIFGMNTRLRQHRWTFSPGVNGQIFTHNYTRWIDFFYRMEMLNPNLMNKISVRNDENPLAVRVGNPDLKGVTNHRMQVGIGRRWKEHQMSHDIGYGLRFFVNQVSQGYTYDPATGVYTYRPENVRGNWQTYFWNSFNRTLDKQNRLSLNNYTHGDYSRNVDIAAAASLPSSQSFRLSSRLSSYYDDIQNSGGESQNGGSRLSHVNNWYIENRLTLNYRLNDLSLGAQGYIEYRRATNTEKTIETIDAVNFSYGITANYNFKAETWPTLVRGLSIATDLKMFSRRGYGDASLNQNDLVWNASLSRTFSMKKAGSLTMRLEGFDLLSQLTNTNIVINGQGRTVTVANTLPRYVMLHLTYNFSHMPKKR